jgi:hypothetical protein
VGSTDFGKLNVGSAGYFLREGSIERLETGTWSTDAED